MHVLKTFDIYCLIEKKGLSFNQNYIVVSSEICDSSKGNSIINEHMRVSFVFLFCYLPRENCLCLL